MNIYKPNEFKQRYMTKKYCIWTFKSNLKSQFLAVLNTLIVGIAFHKYGVTFPAYRDWCEDAPPY